MIKVMKLVNSDSDSNTYRVELFADTKSELIPEATIVGLPTGASIEMGSSCVTANAEIAFMKSDGTWNWA